MTKYASSTTPETIARIQPVVLSGGIPSAHHAASTNGVITAIAPPIDRAVMRSGSPDVFTTTCHETFITAANRTIAMIAGLTHR